MPLADADPPGRRSSPDAGSASPPDEASLARPRPGSGSGGHARAPSNERSPLLSPRPSQDDSTVVGFDRPSLEGAPHDDDGQETKSMLYLVLLTISIGGLQIAWCVELSNGTPYLLSLGLSKSLMALVWIAGPLSGTLVQPYVGIRSDNCRIPWGKRKPFMLGGAAATMVSLLALAWAREISRGFLGVFGAAPESEGVRTSTIVVAVVFVYVLDFSINTVQAAIRAFIVDCAPTHQQESANAWAGRITGVGNILGYLAGYVDLPRIMPFFGRTQFQVLCVIASIALGSTVLVSCLFVPERDPRLEGAAPASRGGVLAFFRQVFSSIRRLPPQIRAVCAVQFFAWIGWFPFLFYITTYIGQLYVNPIFAAKPDMPPEEVDVVWEKATRVGTLALLVFAFTSFAANILLPLFIAPSFADPGAGTRTAHSTPLLDRLIVPGLTLRRTWMLSLILYALTIFATLFVRTPSAGIVLVGVVGVSWAVTLWAPFALISAEISKRDALRRRARTAGAVDDGLEDQAGIVLGLHNVAIAAPQIIATLGSSVLFRLLQRPRGTPGDDSVGWVLRVGALASLAAAFVATRVREADAVDGDGDGGPSKAGGDVERGRSRSAEAVGLMRGIGA
ncbi:MAG: hypothetical protein M1832_001241 [Thelocarpon impressellum]|nr:MAG: hypothetical protein M1832_001241 [Thelocarpon impressellum]